MERTEEFHRLTGSLGKKDRGGSEDAGPLGIALRCAKELRGQLLTYKTDRKLAEIAPEKEVVDSLQRVDEVVDLLEGASTAEKASFLKSVALSLQLLSKEVERRLERKKLQRRKKGLSLVLEPEKAPSTAKVSHPMMQMLQEENSRILESVQYSEREVGVVRRKISEIDVLQRLISQEIFSQDERIESVLTKTGSASIDIKISRNYLRSSREKSGAARRFLAMVIFIFSLAILLLHLFKR